MDNSIPVITLDGPSGSGKSTLARALAVHLGWHFLDSGALYRCVALLALSKNLSLKDNAAHLKAIVTLAEQLDVQFLLNKTGRKATIKLDGQRITDEIRTHTCATAASTIASNPGVRQALLTKQRAFLQAPGLVADGRDMGTVVFPEASHKFFIDATPAKRAARRKNQLARMGVHVGLEELREKITQRDHQDRNRAIAPLKPATDAIVIDTSDVDIQTVLSLMLKSIDF